jgi:DHA3 family tetracycline resistance protein-like MFS transporter
MQRALSQITLFQSLTHRSFALLWSGQTLSRVGDHLYTVALAWWVLQKTGSATAMGTVLIFSFTPMLVFLLLGGVAVDRFPRVRLMLASDVLRGVVVSLVAVLAAMDLLQLWHVYLASLLFGFVDAFFQPAYTALVPQVTPSEALLSANSLTGLSQQLGRVIGPAIGAAVVSLGGTPAAFAVNGLSFFVSAACLLPLLGLPLPVVAESQAAGVLHGIREALQLILRSPWLWISILASALTNVTLSGPYAVALPFLVKDTLHADVGTLGLLYAMFPIGYMLAELWTGSRTRLHRRGVLGYSGLMLAGAMILVLGLPVPLIVMALAALINGAGLELQGLIWTNTLQEMVPSDKLGRVASVDLLGSFALLPIGYGLTGWATDLLGPPLVFILGGGITVLAGALALTHPAIRRLD